MDPTTQSLRQSAHDMITRWGGADGEIVRGAVPRTATMAITDYTWQERQTVAVDNLVKIRVSCIPSDPGIDHKLDVIVFKNVLYSIERPPRGPKPHGDFVYLDCDCIAKDEVS